MKRWVTLVWLLLLVLVIASDQGAESTPLTVQAQPVQAVTNTANLISITDSGFDPLALRVGVGAVVTWQNNSSTPQTLQSGSVSGLVNYLPYVVNQSGRAASTSAPSLPRAVADDLFPITLAPGETFSFIYNAVGEYAYHLKATPTHSGRVIVESRAPVNLTANPTVASAPSTINFTASINGAPNETMTLLWAFGDGTPQTENVTTGSTGVIVTEGENLYLDDGNFSASLTVTDSQGAVARDNIAIAIDPYISILQTSPASGEIEVAVTRETVIEFSGPVNDVSPAAFAAQFGGNELSARLHLSPDRKKVTLFYDEFLPASARVRVTVDGDELTDDQGQAIDADGDGVPGGVAMIDFDTLSLTTIPNTSVCGTVFASELGDNGNGGTQDVPLEGVTVTVDGMEDTLFALTDGNGEFCLESAPAGRFFVHIDGRTATNGVPAGAYYPFVGKAWESVPGQQVDIGNVYLPLVAPNTLQSVSATADTEISFPQSVLNEHPEFADVSITVPADSLYADDGTGGGSVGIAPVPPDRLPGQLPEGLEPPLVITVQSDGATNFDTPVPVCFPNLDDPILGEPLSPGEKNELVSFDHDSGSWRAAGSMTVTADGQLICSDTNVGIIAPGWHISAPPTIGPGGCSTNQCPISNRLQGNCEDCEKSPPSGDWGALGGDDPSVLEDILGLSNLIGKDGCKHLLDGTPEGDNNYLLCQRDEFRDDAQCMNETGKDLATEAANGELPGIAPGMPPGINDIWNYLKDAVIDYFGFEIPFNNIEDSVEVLNDSVEVLEEEGFSTSSLIPIAWARATLRLTYSDPPTTLNVGDAIRVSDLSDFGFPTTSIATLMITEVEAENQYIAEAAVFSINQISPALLSGIRSELADNEPPYGIKYMASISRPTDSLFLRSETAPYGEYSLFIPRNGRLRFVSFYDPHTSRYGLILPRRDEDFLHHVTLTPVDETFADFDNDNLPDLVEQVYGTKIDIPDSDQDGLLDGAEVQQGTDPLSGFIAQTGIVAAADTPGSAVDICAVNNLAVVADANAGVSVFDVTTGQNPVTIARVNTFGSAQGVACAGDRVALADGNEGLIVLDISDPPAAHVEHQIPFPNGARDVATAGNLAYVLSGKEVAVVDLTSGALLDRHSYPGGGMNDLAIAGDYLYLVALRPTAKHTVMKVALGATLTDPVALLEIEGHPSFGRVHITAGDGYIYVGSPDNNWAEMVPGIEIIRDDGDQLTLVGPPSALTAFDVAVNGSGLALYSSAEACLYCFLLPGRIIGPNQIGLLDVSDPTQTDQFLTAIELPDQPAAISLYNGLAYVADREAGMQVVNYLPYDAQGVAPTINLSTSFGTQQVEEGQRVRVTAQVDDDVQVRNVEFYLNDELLITDGNFPFETYFITPRRDTETTFTLQAKATDTGGNSSWADLGPITLLADNTAPTALPVTPLDGSSAGTDSVSAVAAGFSEPIDTATLDTSSYQLISAGDDGVLDTGDDVVLTDGQVTFIPENNTAVLSFAQPLTANSYRAVLQDSIADLAGNTLTADVSWTFEIRDPVYWVTDDDGFWDVAGNWSTGQVPQAGDIVIIDRPSGQYTITHRVNSPSVAQIISEETLVLSGGTLNIEERFELVGPFTLAGGILDLAFDGELIIPADHSLNWTGGSIRGTTNGLFSASQIDNQGTIALSGAANKTLNWLALNNAGTVTWGGTGRLILANGAVFNNLPPGLLDIQSDSRLANTGGVATLNNDGIVRKSASSGETTFSGNILFNGGRIEVLTGTLRFASASEEHVWTNGDFTVADGARLDINDGTASRKTFVGAFTGSGDGQVTLTVGRLEIDPEGIVFDFPPGMFEWGNKGNIATSLITGPGVLTNTGTINITGIADRYLDNVTLHNAGTIVWDESARINTRNGTTIHNLSSGLFDMQNNRLLHWTGDGEQTVFINDGLLSKSGGSSNSTFQGIMTTNMGTVQVLTGTINFSDNAPYVQTDGFLRLDGGTIESITPPIDLQGGRLTGSGTVASSVVSSAVIDPGDPVGAINISGNYTQNGAGEIAIEIGGLTPTTDFDQLLIGGQATLAGSLTITLTNGYEPNLGDTFQIITFDSRVGEFTAVNGLEIGNGKRFLVKYRLNDVILEVVTVP